MNRLKELRQEKGLSQKELAKDIGVHYRTLQNWENGKAEIKTDKAEKLSNFFGVSVGDLLGYVGSRPNELKLSPATIEAIDKAKQTFNQLDKNKQEIIELVANYDIAELVEKTFSAKVLGDITKLFNLLDIYFSVEKNYSDDETEAFAEFRDNLLVVIEDMYELAIKIRHLLPDEKT